MIIWIILVPISIRRPTEFLKHFNTQWKSFAKRYPNPKFWEITENNTLITTFLVYHKNPVEKLI